MHPFGKQRSRRRWFIAPGFGDDQGGGRNPAGGAQSLQRAFDKLAAIGRIQQDQVAFVSRRYSACIDRKNAAASLCVQGGDVGPQGSQRGAVVLHESDMRGAA